MLLMFLSEFRFYDKVLLCLLNSVQIEKRRFRHSVFSERVSNWFINQTIFAPFREDLALQFSS